MTLLLVLLGGAIGAPLRYLTDRAVRARVASSFPWGTLVVNLVGSVLLGALTAVAAALPDGAGPLFGTGLCGAFTTFSTLSYETLCLVEARAHRLAALNVGVSLAAGLAAVALGFGLGRLLLLGGGPFTS